MEQDKQPFLIYQNGELQNKADLALYKAEQTIRNIGHLLNKTAQVGSLVIDHIIQTAQ